MPLGPERYRGQGFEYVPHGPGLGGTLRFLNGGRFININHYPPRFAGGRRAVMGRPNDPLDLHDYNPVPPDVPRRRQDDEVALDDGQIKQEPDSLDHRRDLRSSSSPAGISQREKKREGLIFVETN